MSKKIEKYTGEKSYMFPNGELGTPEVVRTKYPAVSVFTHIVETDDNGEVMFALQNLSAMRTLYNVDPSLPESEAIQAIEDILNTPTSLPESAIATPEERTAAALEMIAINGMPDAE